MDEAKRAEVYAVIDGERDYQDAQGSAHIVPDLPLAGHLLAMEKCLSDARAAWYSGTSPHAETMANVRKVAALGVAAMERFGAVPRNRTGPP